MMSDDVEVSGRRRERLAAWALSLIEDDAEFGRDDVDSIEVEGTGSGVSFVYLDSDGNPLPGRV